MGRGLLVTILTCLMGLFCGGYLKVDRGRVGGLGFTICVFCFGVFLKNVWLICVDRQLDSTSFFPSCSGLYYLISHMQLTYTPTQSTVASLFSEQIY